MTKTSRTTRNVPLVRVGAGVVAAALLAACGGGGGNEASGGGTSPEQVAAAEEFVAKAAKDPAELPIKEPLSSAPEKGKTVVFMSCEAEICGVYDKAFQEAADSVGWKVKRIPVKVSDPATVNAGLDEALRSEPEAVFLTSIAPELYASKVDAFVKADVPLITAVTEQSEDKSGLFIDVASTPWIEQHGDILANWVTGDSKGEANIIVTKISDLDLFKTMGAQFNERIGEICPGCTVTEVDVSYAEFASGGGQDQIVSALQRDSSVDYVVSMSGTLMSGMPAKLKAAGLQDQATLAIAQARELNMVDIVSGDLAAATNMPVKIISWLMFDAALRFSAGEDVDPKAYNEAVDLQLMTKDNVGTPTSTRELPEDYQSQFKSLWGVN